MVRIPKKYNLDPADAPLCACGCGKQVMWNKRYKDWSKFVKGHSAKNGISEETRAKQRKASRARWPTLLERFNVNIGKPDEAGCLPWLGSRDTYGYGVISDWGKTRKAHRVAWELAFGAIPDKFHVLHVCDNPSCVNKNHLFLGTNGTNIADRTVKGRQAKGSRHGNAKLTEKDAATAKLLLSFGYSQTYIAKLFNVTNGCIWHIEHSNSWKHV